MTASEKLRALDASATEPPWHEGRVVSGEDGFLWFGERGDLLPEDIAFVVALRNALPLIADVVEAAEQFVAPWDEEHYPQLRRPLTALREHLEGGVVRDSTLTDRFDWNSRDGVTFDAGAEGGDVT